MYEFEKKEGEKLSKNPRFLPFKPCSLLLKPCFSKILATFYKNDNFFLVS